MRYKDISSNCADLSIMVIGGQGNIFNILHEMLFSAWNIP